MNTLPFSQVNPFEFQRRVFAHYFYPFPLSFDNLPATSDYYNTQYLTTGGENGKWAPVGGYLRARPLDTGAPLTGDFKSINRQNEVKRAIAIGIAGWCVDILNLADALSLTGNLKLLSVDAFTVEPEFSIVPMADMSAMPTLTTDQAVQLFTFAAGLPNIYKFSNGQILVSAFNATQPLQFWEEIIAKCAAKGVDLAFVPILLGSPLTSPLDSVDIGVGDWGTATAAASLSPASFMAAIETQQYRPKESHIWEASNTQTFRNCWQMAIAGGHPFAQIITWNDFSEGAQVQPYTDASLELNIGTTLYELAAYYITWFVTGQQPAITRDVLYCFYRRMASTAAHLDQPTPLTWVSSTEESNIECLAFLVAPGTVVINGVTTDCPAGITSVKVPATPGVPTFALRRNIISFNGPVQIYGPEGSPAGVLDMLYWGCSGA
jgi:glycosyl hydrolase family 71